MWGILFALLIVISVTVGTLYATGRLDKLLQKDKDIFDKGEEAYVKTIASGEKVGLAAVNHRAAMKDAYIQKYPDAKDVDKRVEEILYRFMPPDQLTNFLRAEYEYQLEQGKDPKPPVYPFPSYDGGGGGGGGGGSTTPGTGSVGESCNKVGDRICATGLTCGPGGTCVTSNLPSDSCISSSNCPYLFSCIASKCVFNGTGAATGATGTTGGGDTVIVGGGTTTVIVQPPPTTPTGGGGNSGSTPATVGATGQTPATAGATGQTPAKSRKLNETCSIDNDCEGLLGCLYGTCQPPGDGSEDSKCGRMRSNGTEFDALCSGLTSCVNGVCTKGGNGTFGAKCGRNIDQQCSVAEQLQCNRGICDILPGNGTSGAGCLRLRFDQSLQDKSCGPGLRCSSVGDTTYGRCWDEKHPHFNPGPQRPDDRCTDESLIVANSSCEWKRRPEGGCQAAWQLNCDQGTAERHCKQVLRRDGANNDLFICTQNPQSSASASAPAPVVDNRPRCADTRGGANCDWRESSDPRVCVASASSTCNRSEAISSCAQKTNSTFVTFPNDPNFNSNPYTCRMMGNEKKDNGMDCTQDNQCKSLLCITPAGGGRGSCVANSNIQVQTKSCTWQVDARNIGRAQGSNTCTENAAREECNLGGTWVSGLNHNEVPYTCNNVVKAKLGRKPNSLTCSSNVECISNSCLNVNGVSFCKGKGGGDSCDINEECATNECPSSTKRCKAPKKGNREACSNDDECESSICNRGICSNSRN